MKLPRLKMTSPGETGSVCYHCVTRTGARKFFLGQAEKDYLVRLMREYEQFTGVRVLTYCMMSDHFHLLLEVPPRPQETLGDQELLAKLRKIPGHNGAELIEQQLAGLRQRGDTAAAEALIRKVAERMYDVSWFLKPLKQRLSLWYNPTHGRQGTLWDQRYKSVLVESSGLALEVLAAYVDLNPVRAGLVEDPKDYPWCGYADALSGGAKARESLRKLMAAARGETVTFKQALAGYQELMFGTKAKAAGTRSAARPVRHGTTAAEAAELLERKARLPLADYLRMRIRYFTDGVAVGSRDFVNGVFATHRREFGPKRKDGARPLRLLDSTELYCMRDLKVRVFGKE